MVITVRQSIGLDSKTSLVLSPDAELVFEEARSRGKLCLTCTLVDCI